MSEWTTPPQSVEYRAPTSGLGVLRKALDNLSRRLSALEGTAPLKQAGIYLTTLGMRIASSLTVAGDFTSTGSATIGGTLDVTGATMLGSTLDLSGTGTVTGTLQSLNFVAGTSGWRLTSTGLEVNTITVKDLLIGDAALSSLVKPDAGNAAESGVTVTTSFTSFAIITFTVPAGCSTASVVAASSLAISTTSLGVTMATKIDGTNGQVMNVYPDSGNVGNGSSNFARVFAVTPAATYTVTTRVATATGTGTAIVTTSAGVTYYR